MNTVTDLKEFRKKVGKVVRLAEQIALAGDDVSDAVERILWDRSDQNVEVISTDRPELAQLQAALSAIRAAVFRSYWVLTEPDDLEFDFPDSALASTEFDPALASFFDVKAAVSDGALIIKMPLLWSRQTAVIHSGKNMIRSDYLPWLRNELACALAEIENDIPYFPRRNFAYLHVIPTGAKRFSDSDNYDTKAITDTVTAHLGGDDNALETSFSLYSMRAGQLPTSTYLMVTDAFGAPPKMDEMTRKIASVWP